MAGQAPDTTASAEFEAPNRRPRRSFLFVVLRADRPLTPSARVSLDGLKSVSLGRSTDEAISISGGEGSISLRLPDRRISSSHARLACAGGRWSIEDVGSKNGTFLNGARIPESAPLDDDDLIEVGHTFLLFREQLPVSGKIGALLDSADIVPPAPGLATLLPPLDDEFARLAVVAASKLPVIIGGESGAGKELVAAAIHKMSRRPGASQAVNCGAIPAALVESELFGHRKGAFSGADEDRPGLIRSA